MATTQSLPTCSSKLTRILCKADNCDHQEEASVSSASSSKCEERQRHSLVAPKAVTTACLGASQVICVHTRDYMHACTICAHYCMILPLCIYPPNMLPSSGMRVDVARASATASSRERHFCSSPTAATHRTSSHHLHLHPIPPIHTTTHHVRRPSRFFRRRRCPAPRLLRLGQQRT